MKYPKTVVRTSVSIQPVFRLVDLFSESTEYERSWKLPFNSFCLCAAENPDDPSWIDLPEKSKRMIYEKNVIHFTTCDTPMRIRYTTANLHLCIHFRYELFSGVDLFSGIHERYVIRNKHLSDKIKAVFADPDPLRRLARAEAAATEMLLDFWPEQLPLNLHKAAEFEELFRYVRENLNCRIVEVNCQKSNFSTPPSVRFHNYLEVVEKTAKILLNTKRFVILP